MRRLLAGFRSLGAVAVVAWIPAGCSSQGGQAGQSGAGASLPLLTPPVRAATPQGLGGSGVNLLHPSAATVRSITVDGGAGPDAFPPPPEPDGSAGLDGAMGPGLLPSSDAGAVPGPCPGLGPDASPDSCPGPNFDASAVPGPCPGLGPDASPDSCPGTGSDASPGPGPAPEGGMGPGLTPGPGPGSDGGMGPGLTPGPGPGSEGGMAPRSGASLDARDIKSRFFSAGPTNIFSILGEIDARINEINGRSQGKDVPCLSQTPVLYTLTPFGESVPFYAQCVSRVSTPTPARAAFVQFGQKDGITYLYEAIGAESIGARVAAVGASGQYAVDAWMAVGYDNATGCGNGTGFDDCSYGVMALKADSSHLTFELSVAGIGFGYCGAQLKSDGATVYLKGSGDMGATCNESASLCVSASDVATPVMCTSSSFALPALGRAATSGPNGVWGSSKYPGVGSDAVILDGTSTDSLGFGPSVPTPGVPEFVATSPSTADRGDASAK